MLHTHDGEVWFTSAKKYCAPIALRDADRKRRGGGGGVSRLSSALEREKASPRVGVGMAAIGAAAKSKVCRPGC